MLSVRKRKDSPYWQIHGTIALPNGSIRVRESTKYTEKQDAEKYALQRATEIINGHGGRSHTASYTFQDATVDFLKTQKRISSSEASRISYLNAHFGRTCISKVTNGMFNAVFNRTKSGIKPSTYNRHISTFRGIALFASKQVSPNIPIQRIYKRQVGKPKPRFLTIEEQERLLNEYNPTIRPIFIFLCYQGCRIGEALCLSWADINMDKRTVTFWQTKNGDFRTIPLHSRVYEMLRGINRPREGAVFISTNQKPFKYYWTRTGTVLEKTHKEACKRANIRGFNLHKWRSHWASHLAINGVNAHQLMQLAGWNDPRSASHYIRLNVDSLKNAMEIMK